MAVPTVGPRGAGVIRLTPQVHRYLRTLATHIAQAEYGPQIAVDRAALQTVRHTRKTDVRSVRGASQLAERQVAVAQKALPKSGLKGQYLQQVGQEYAARRADIASSTPGLTATVAGQYAAPIASAKQTIMGDRAQIQSEAARNFYGLLDKAKTQARSTIAKRQAKRQAQKPTPTQRRASAKTHRQNVKQARQSINNAVQVGLHMLTTLPKKAPFPTSAHQWAQFEEAMAANSNVGTPTQRTRLARIAVRRIQNNPALLRRSLAAAGYTPAQIRQILSSQALQGAVGVGGSVGIG